MFEGTAVVTCTLPLRAGSPATARRSLAGCDASGQAFKTREPFVDRVSDLIGNVSGRKRIRECKMLPQML